MVGVGGWVCGWVVGGRSMCVYKCIHTCMNDKFLLRKARLCRHIVASPRVMYNQLCIQMLFSVRKYWVVCSMSWSELLVQLENK